MRGNIYCLFMKNLYTRSLLILVFFMALFLNHLFSYYTYMIFLMIIFVILQSWLIGLSILRVIWLLICDKSLSWFLNLKMTNKTMRTGTGSSSLISILGTLNLLNIIIKTTTAIDVKVDMFVIDEKGFKLSKVYLAVSGLDKSNF